VQSSHPPVMKRFVPCCVCGGEDHSLVYPDELGTSPPQVDYNFSKDTRKTFAIVKCISCGMVFTNPMPLMESVYRDTIDQVYLNSSHQRTLTSKAALNRLLHCVLPGGSLLDIGCSTGIFLSVAAKYFDVEGLEFSTWAADIAQKSFKVHRLPVSKLGFSEVFDVITMFGVIEHLEDPGEELAAIFAALKPGGTLLVYTGDLDSWMARLLGKRWWWFQGMHLLFFSRKTLSALLHKHGFQPYKHELHTVYFQLFSLAASLRRYFFGRLIAPFFELPGIRNFTVPLRLSGELIVYARKPSVPPARIDTHPTGV
jgi:SAM-dependent methyltransferase